MEKTAVCPDTAVLRDTIQITVCQDALFQRLKGDDSFAVFSGSLFQAVLFDCPVKDIIGILFRTKGQRRSSRIRHAFIMVSPS